MQYLAAIIQLKSIHLVMHRHNLVSLSFIALLFCSANAMSCSCISEHGSLEAQVTAAFSSASHVVWAKAESTQDMSFDQQDTSNTKKTNANSNRPEKQRTKFVSIESWKGAHPKRFSTEITTICCVCGYRFVEGTEYLLYLYNGPNKEGYYRTSICTRTKPMTSATSQEIKLLRELTLTPAESKPTPTCSEMG